jgi:O-antigen/teichoic acid export membrane protein
MSSAIGYPLTPYFASTIGRGNHHELESSWLNTTLALQTVSLAMPAVIFFCGETFLELWLGSEYSVAGRMVLFILLAGLVADSFATNAYSILTAQGRHGKTALMWLVCSVVSILLGIGGAYFWGVTGVAAGTTIATVAGNLLTVTMACAVMRMPLITYFRKTLLRILPALLVLATALWGLGIFFIEKTYLNLVFQICIAGILYLLAIWCFSLTNEIRGKISSRLQMVVTGKGF